MNTRIRYLMQNNTLITKERFLAGAEVVFARIHSNYTVEVVRFDDNVVVSVIHGRTINECKKLLKTQLKSLGVKFGDEVRPGRSIGTKLMNEMVTEQ